MKFIIVIPARYQSTRFPGKPLIEIMGKTMIERVHNQCALAVDLDLIYIATDDVRIQSYCESKKFNCLMTSKHCLTGTDRVAEVSKMINADYYINIQGDEPLFDPNDIKILIKSISNQSNDYDVFSGYCDIFQKADFFSYSIPKLIFNQFEELVYMSRSPIPGNKNVEFNFGYRQVCAYAFSKSSLNVFGLNKVKTKFEEEEDIEILRFVELGLKVKMVKMSNNSISVDKKEDLTKVLNALNVK